MVVDDDANCLRATRRALRAVNAELMLIEGGPAAVAYLSAHTVDLVVMDVGMPEIDGIAATRQIMAVNPQRIVLVTAYTTTGVRLAASDAGAAMLYSKPYDIVGVLRSELEKAEQIKSGKGSVQLLTDAHLDMAKNIARSLARRYGSLLSQDDIDGLAYLGLCEAAARYDATRDEVFIAFAAARVRGAVIDAVRKHGVDSRVAHKRKREESALNRTLGKVIRQVDEAAPPVDELPSGDSPERRVGEREQLDQLAAARAELADVEAKVLAMRYELGMSVAAIASELRITEHRVQTLHARSLEQLRKKVA